MGALAYYPEAGNATWLTSVIRFGFLTATDVIHWTWGLKLTKVGVNSGATDSKEET
jgi:hypothetical protein